MHAHLRRTHIGDLELRALVRTAHILNCCCQRRERKRSRQGTYALKHLPARERTHSGVSPRVVCSVQPFLTQSRSRTRLELLVRLDEQPGEGAEQTQACGFQRESTLGDIKDRHPHRIERAIVFKRWRSAKPIRTWSLAKFAMDEEENPACGVIRPP